ncbi:MAG: hypothetical protein HOQ29_11165 [Acidobacteria bacterium]|nr:hypothetical protein [Acidobacteriota bacterium]
MGASRRFPLLLLLLVVASLPDFEVPLDPDEPLPRGTARSPPPPRRDSPPLAPLPEWPPPPRRRGSAYIGTWRSAAPLAGAAAPADGAELVDSTDPPPATEPPPPPL